MTATPILHTADEARAMLGEDGARTAARHALWRSGDLSWYSSEIQKTAVEMVYTHPARRKVFETNRRFGKTRTCVRISGEWCLWYPGVRIPYAAPTATQVRTFVHPKMLELTSAAPPDLAPDIIDGEWRFPPMQWYDAAGNPVRTKLHGGVELARFRGKKADELLHASRVAPHGCEDRKKADALRGTGTPGAIVDEARDIPILGYVLTSVLGPMLWEARAQWHPDVAQVLLVASTTPDEPDHPFVDVADAAEAVGARFTATVYDCDHLDEHDIAEAIKEAGGEHTIAWQVEGLAKRMRDPVRAVFPEFNRDAIVREWPRPDYFRPCVIGDGGHVDMALYGFGYLDFKENVLVIEDELVLQRTRSDITDAAIAAKERELWGNVEVSRRRVDAPPQVRADMNRKEWGDPASVKRRADAEDDPPHWQGVTKPRSAGAGSMQQGVNRARILMSGDEPRLAIHPRCTTTIAHVDGARWDRARESFVRVLSEKGEPLHHYDGAAMLVYFVRDHDARNPYPLIPEGVTHDDHFIPPALLQKQRDKHRAFFGPGKRR